MLNRILMELYDDYENNDIKPLLDFANKTFSDKNVSSFFVGCVLILFSRSDSFKARYSASKENLYDIVLSATSSVKGNNLLLFYVERLNAVKGINKYFKDFTSEKIVDCANIVIEYLEQFKPNFLEETKKLMEEKLK